MSQLSKNNVHAHDHGAGGNSRSLTVALILTSTFLVAELVGAWWFNSLALLSDATHMFTDAAALAIALTAIRIGLRPPDKRRTFGYRRLEVLAAAFNALLLFAVAAYILYEGLLRFQEPQPVQSTGMLAVAVAGLIVNLIAMRILAGGKDKSLNVNGAYLEVWSDMLGSLGVIGAALIIRFTGWNWVDPVVAVAIGLWVLPRTWTLLRDSAHVLMEGVPVGLDLAGLQAVLERIPGVVTVEQLRAWSITGSDRILAAKLRINSKAAAEDVLSRARDVAYTAYEVDDATIELDRETDGGRHQGASR